MAEIQRVLEAFLQRLECRIVETWAKSWFMFLIKLSLYTFAICLPFSIVILYRQMKITATDFGYILCLSAIACAVLVMAAKQLTNRSNSEIFWDVCIETLSDFIPNHKHHPPAENDDSKPTCHIPS